MEKLKVGDRVIVVENSWCWQNTPIGTKGIVKRLFTLYGGYLFQADGDFVLWNMGYNDLKLIQENTSTESRSKQISQSLKQICTKGLVIKSEGIIAKVKESIGTEYVFGDTILRALRHLRQDGILDYTADKHTREYTFK